MARFQFSLRFLFLLMTACAIVSSSYRYLGIFGLFTSALTCVGCHEGVYLFRLGRKHRNITDVLFGLAYLGLSLVSYSALVYVALNRDHFNLR